MKIKGFSRKNLAIPYAVFLVLFIILPLLIIAVYAFTDKDWHFSLANFAKFFTQGEAITAIIRSLGLGLLATVICLLLGYPVAYILSKKTSLRAASLVTLFILPMWMNFLLRTVATRALFDFLGVNPGYLTTVFGMVYNFLPFMILPIYNQLAKLDKSYAEAAGDLGANGVQTFIKTTVPLSMPGVISGILMVFMPCMSTFVISQILSKRTVTLFGNVIDTAFNSNEWNYMAALSLIMLAIILVSILVSNKFQKEEANATLW